MKRLVIGLLRFYKIALSSLLGQRCRFYPSCSTYAIEAIERYGVVKGSALAARRITKCHPFHPGGVDPVPERQEA
jgi:putative membrane protein insertion efficiency factor